MPLHEVCNEKDLAVGKMKVVKAGGEKILLYRLEDGFFATQTSCTHTFGPLSRGKIVDGCKIQCPLHRARFDIRTGEVIDLIDELIRVGVRIIVIKQNLILDKEQDDIQSLAMITLLSLFAKMERMMISRRTKEALAARKAQGVTLGKPKGTIQDSIYDKDRERIVELLELGLSARKISQQHLGYGTPSSLNYYIQTRRLREALVK